MRRLPALPVQSPARTRKGFLLSKLHFTVEFSTTHLEVYRP